MEFIGYLAAILTTISFLPQAIKVYKTNHTKDLSLGMFIIFCSGVFLWLIYGVLINNLPIIFANIVTFVLAGYILIKKIKNSNL